MSADVFAGTLRRLRGLLPPESRPGPVTLRVDLVVYVAILATGSVVLAILTVHPVTDAPTLILGGLVVAGASYASVRMTQGVDSAWTSGVFVHLALTLTFGAVGAIVAAVSQAAATAARMRTGWFRAIFNTSDYFLCDMAALAAFSGLVAVGKGPVWGAVAATVAGAVQCLVNNSLLAVVIRLASRGGVQARAVFQRSVKSLILYNVGYGWAAYGAVLLHRVAGTVGFTTTLLPIILLQGFLVLLARRIKAQELEREEHATEREALLQRAIQASDRERKRIASDLHDGVVQTLAGLALSLAARGSGKVADPQLKEAADTLRSSVTDLRTLMIEIAPPDLAEGGIDSALRKLLAPLPARGIDFDLDVGGATHLPPDKTTLVFRVAQEAIRNVVNHSEATRVVARLHFVGGVVTLQIDDNGKGFSASDRSRRREEGHVGLHLLNNAVEASSGRLTLTSEPGQGTSLMLQLPC